LFGYLVIWLFVVMCEILAEKRGVEKRGEAEKGSRSA
jgi:hypothetical protein